MESTCGRCWITANRKKKVKTFDEAVLSVLGADTTDDHREAVRRMDTFCAHYLMLEDLANNPRLVEVISNLSASIHMSLVTGCVLDPDTEKPEPLTEPRLVELLTGVVTTTFTIGLAVGMEMEKGEWTEPAQENEGKERKE